MSVKVSEKGNKELTESLINEGGPLAAGALPEVPADGVDGSKAILEAITDATTSKLDEAKKGKNKEKKEEAEKAEPKTTLECPGFFVVQSSQL